MRGRLVLHVGTHKTGTTAIQQALLSDSARLEANGVLYPNAAWWFGGHPDRASGAAQFRFAARLAEPSGDRDGALLAFRDRLAGGLERHRTVVLSAESLYRHLLVPAGGALDEEAKYAARTAYVERLADVLRGFPVEVLIYFRRPDSFAESVYLEAAASSGARGSFAGFLKGDRFRLDYGFQLGLFERHFPTRAFGFEAAAEEGLLRHFFREAGLGEAPLERGPRLRASVPKRAAFWLVRHKAVGLADRRERAARRRRWLFALQPEHRPLFAAPPEAGFWRSAAERDALVARALQGFDAVAFPPAPSAVVALAPWTAEEDAAAEDAFRDWERRHRARLLVRELRGLMPYEEPELT